MVGGDTSEADDLIINCTMVGFAKRIVTRGGAHPGQLVVTSGRFGQTTAGLRILMDGARAEPRFKKLAVSSVYRPTPRLGLGLALADCLSSSIDSSDGLAISLHTISEMSGVGIRLAEIPYSEGLGGFATLNSYSADGLALYGGEEYEIVGTVDKLRLREAQGWWCRPPHRERSSPSRRIRRCSRARRRRPARHAPVAYRNRALRRGTSRRSSSAAESTNPPCSASRPACRRCDRCPAK